MPLDLSEFKALIEENIESAEVQIHDPRGDGRHFEATILTETVFITSPSFSGKTIIEQHRIVHKILAEKLDSDVMNTVSVKTAIPEGR